MTAAPSPDRFARLRTLAPPHEAIVTWIEIAEEDLHFVDAALALSDNLVNVRREYRECAGRKFFKVFVAPGQVDEVLAILERLRRFIRIGEIQVEW